MTHRTLAGASVLSVLLLLPACDPGATTPAELDMDAARPAGGCPAPGLCPDPDDPPGSSVRSHAAAVATASVAWAAGDVFAGIAAGRYSVFDNTGLFKETVADGLGGFTTGCGFSGTLDRLYTTNYSHTKVVVYDDLSPHSILQTIDTDAGSPGGHSESVVFDAAGNFYVGHPDGDRDVHKYDANGNLVAKYDVAVEDRGSDWVELSADQTTLFYTSEGGRVMRYDVGAGVQLPDFANVGGVTFALRLLPPGDGSGGLLVAHLSDILRLDATGAVVKTYDAPGEDGWFSLNLDPNGTSFWSGEFGTEDVYRFDIATGAIEVGPVPSGGRLFGLCLKGEPTAGTGEDGRLLTGRGSFFDASGARFTHGFELHCDASAGTSWLEVDWPRAGGRSNNRFRLETLEAASCRDDPNLDEGSPAAGFDTFVGSGTGRLNGEPGHTISFAFTDDGEPGTGVDVVSIDIDGGTLTAAGMLDRGNHQAHR